MDIPNPRRILILSPPDTPTTAILNALTATTPSTPTTSTTTTPSPAAPDPTDPTHHIHTRYYTAHIPIWHDTIHPTWPTQWLLPAASPVVAAIGAFVLVVRHPLTTRDVNAIKTLARAVDEVIDVGGGGRWEGVRVVVGVGGVRGEGLEEVGGWEWVDGGVDVEEGGRRGGEFGELTGLARLKEALETNDWEGDDGEGLEGEGLELGEEEEEEGFEAEAAEVEREMLEMRRAIYEAVEEDGVGEEEEGEGEDMQVEELESMMLKMQAIRDMGADMPSSERKKFAAKAVRDIMKSI